MIDSLERISAEYWWLSIIPVISVLIPVVLVPLIVVNLPVDYFVRNEKREKYKKSGFPLSYILYGLKTLSGFLIVCMGIVLLFIPGQGLLTIFTGLVIMDFPGKRKLELILFQRKSVRKAINWIRGRWGKEKLGETFTKA
ncbi:MAG: PGPGW domain-containing protein [Spirochaetales bacterium]|nr:PGPGW domain-containing protein [Spirochaetales bacterium]